MRRKFHIGAQNDHLYIVSGKAPAKDNDHPIHEADRTVVAKVYDEGEARRLVFEANSIEIRDAEIARLTNERDEALQELRNIANARPWTWDDASDFTEWAQSRARFRLGAALEA